MLASLRAGRIAPDGRPLPVHHLLAPLRCPCAGLQVPPSFPGRRGSRRAAPARLLPHLIRGSVSPDSFRFAVSFRGFDSGIPPGIGRSGPHRLQRAWSVQVPAGVRPGSIRTTGFGPVCPRAPNAVGHAGSPAGPSWWPPMCSSERIAWLVLTTTVVSPGCSYETGLSAYAPEVCALTERLMCWVSNAANLPEPAGLPHREPRPGSGAGSPPDAW